MKPVVEIRDYAYQYPGRRDWALSHVNLAVQPGECVCFTGPSGCGKTTLFLAIKGLIKGGREEGVMRAGNGSGHRSTGFVFQNAEHQLLCTNVADEVAFGPLNLGYNPQEIETAVQKSLAAVALDGFESRNVETLSAGQSHRLAIASVISTSPGMLILDEPAAQLDGPGKKRLAALLREMKSSGLTLMIADHELGPFESLADRFVFMDRGRIERIDRQLSKAYALFPPGPHTKNSGAEEQNRTPLVFLEDLVLSGSNGRPLFDGLNLRIYPGRRVFIHGRNGAGKSTLLKCMAGVIRPEAGGVDVAGMGRPVLNRLLGKIGFLFQNPERQLFEDSVWHEVAFSLKRMGLDKDEIRSRVAGALETFEVSHLKDHSPLTLSFGEQHRVALASVMAPQPEILMLDEPFAGLDFTRRKHILNILSRLSETKGATVVIASHEYLPDENWADEIFSLKDGRIERS